MILKDKTVSELGYTVESLSNGSKKIVWVNCDYCNRDFTKPFRDIKKGHAVISNDCCAKCKHKKIKEVNLKKYGCENQWGRSDLREQMRLEYKEKCGVEYHTQLQSTKDKAAQTNLERYGVANAMHSEELKQKQKDTLMENYGVENPSQCQEIQEKKKVTNLARFGTNYYFGSQDHQYRTKKAMNERYGEGVDNPFQAEEIKEKSRQTCLKKYGATHFLKNKENARIHAKNVLKSQIDSGLVKLIEGKTISEWREQSEYSDSRFRTLINQYGFEIASTMTPRQSSLEVIMKNFLDSEVIIHERKKLGNYYPDFILPEHNLIIEVDGLYWHSDAINKDKYYHRDKKDFYTKEGFKSLFFRENEILERFEIIKSVILNQCKKSKKLFARKLELKQIENDEANLFINENHLMGASNGGSVNLGLFDSETMYCVIQLKKHKEGYDVSRYCNKLGYSVVGGFSRLIKAAQKFPGAFIQTFVDMRYGTGNHLESLGFVKDKTYMSFMWTCGNEVFHRLKFRSNLGYTKRLFKIWDCGQAKFTLYK